MCQHNMWPLSFAVTEQKRCDHCLSCVITSYIQTIKYSRRAIFMGANGLDASSRSWIIFYHVVANRKSIGK